MDSQFARKTRSYRSLPSFSLQNGGDNDFVSFVVGYCSTRTERSVKSQTALPTKMSWRVALGNHFKQIRFFVCEPFAGENVKSLSIEALEASNGLRQLVQRERDEWLMLNPGLVIPVTYHKFYPNYPAHMEFFTKTFSHGTMDCKGLKYGEIEDKLESLIYSLQNGQEVDFKKIESHPFPPLSPSDLRHLSKKEGIFG